LASEITVDKEKLLSFVNGFVQVEANRGPDRRMPTEVVLRLYRLIRDANAKQGINP
jgi:hypothetical protein